MSLHRRLAAAGIAALCATALVACGNGSDTGVPASSSAAVPTADVVSSVATDPALHSRVPGGATSLTLGTSPTPGVNNLPHGGEVPAGHEVGLDVDLRNAVAKVLGVNWNQQHGTFSTIIPGVQSGRYQVGQSNFGVTAARLQVVDFATYLADGQSFLGAPGTNLGTVRKLTDLCGKKIATAPGSTFQDLLEKGKNDCAKEGKPSYTVQYYNDNGAITLALQTKKADVQFGPTLSLQYTEGKIPGTKYLGQISSTTVGFVTKKGSPLARLLVDAVNKLIETGDYAKIFAKWGVAETGIKKSELSPAPSF
ncbi:transporter substrate-binding domain-containing protein [Tsukamurella sp. 8F]|uniref:transporter substrate-binding domain-containing protein n=1 Tax=unclassified Tsukamurella TaxID=2633480 RepID=UPI0023B9CD1A|nr:MULTISPECIES: transporter substrate-binding domain-containing protein [unclassified Tsukamurella]MDF0530586.1 transporter substrate-binding domain-containing protein [Tsukamurella sp. 8J]MDF0586764.1 transporter substrate-binding domain-containing protein [Tsukamurella sp. 8F]